MATVQDLRGATRVLIALAAASVLAGCGTSSGAPPASSGRSADAPAPRPARAPGQQPNIVFVLTDDLDSSLLRFMPQVQQLQREGVDFTNYGVTDSLCCPSRASILTGQVPHNTGVFTNQAPNGGFTVFRDRGKEQSTLATGLQQRGYQTAMMGKYLNGYQPGKPGGHGYVPPGWNEWDVAGNGYPEYNYTLNENGAPKRYGHQSQDYLTDVLAGKGEDFIREQAATNTPFLLQIATFAPHGPYTPAPRDRHEFPGLTAPRDPAFNEADVTDKPPWLAEHRPLSPKQQATIDRDYRKRAQAVQAVDDMLGRLRATLAQTGQTANTHVVFSSDNGFHLGQHRLASGKQTAFDTDVHVPLTIAGPGLPAGRTAPEPTANIDLAPTFTDIGGAGLPAADGRSLLPLLQRRPVPDWRAATLVEHHGPGHAASDPDRQSKARGNPPSYAALRSPTATYVEYAGGAREYYDRARDPHELTNTYPTLPPAQRTQLHTTLARMSHCHGTTNCDTTTHPRP